MVNPKPDSIYQNWEKLKPGIVMATEEGDYQVLEKPTFTGWTVKDLHTKERRNLDLIKEMTEMRYIGRLHNQTEDWIHIINDENQIIFLEQNLKSSGVS